MIVGIHLKGINNPELANFTYKELATAQKISIADQMRRLTGSNSSKFKNLLLFKNGESSNVECLAIARHLKERQIVYLPINAKIAYPVDYFLGIQVNKAIMAVLNGNPPPSDLTELKEMLSYLEITENSGNKYYFNHEVYSYKELSDLLGLSDYDNEGVYNRLQNQQAYQYQVQMPLKEGVFNVKSLELGKVASYKNLLYFNFTVQQMHDLRERIKSPFASDGERICYSDLFNNTLFHTNSYIVINQQKHDALTAFLDAISARIDANYLPGELYFRLINDSFDILKKYYSYIGRFLIQGIKYSDRDLNYIIQITQVFKNKYQVKLDPIADLSNRYHSIMRSQTAGNTSTQNVHNPLILQIAETQLFRMKKLSGERASFTDATLHQNIANLYPGVKKDNCQIQNFSSLQAILERISTYLNDTRNLNEPYGLIGHTFQKTLSAILIYIYSQANELKDQLLGGLIWRIDEILREDPCNVGQLQRLLDTPNGIDDRFFLTQEIDLKDGIEQLASQMRADFEEEMGSHNQSSQSLDEISFELFKTKALHLYQKILKLDEALVLSEIERMRYGFIMPSAPLLPA